MTHRIDLFRSDDLPPAVAAAGQREALRARRPSIRKAWVDAGESTAELELRPALRMQRQAVLDRHDPPQPWAVIGEAALRRPVGDESIMSEQLNHIAAMAEERPNITVQVLLTFTTTAWRSFRTAVRTGQLPTQA
ncbi:Scr1 family TA system antitoxin-like transcriptional regulator [Kitasatospora sp. NPDC015120]|uniref:Scr1 family TA system antitoxin-like transcriptional regulator n=1 Tax=Kitasatospora sp. NPDC015120 TaxID=3364023 RepID=UPI0036F4A2C1